MAEHQYAQQPKKTDNTSQKKTISPKQFPTSHPAAIIQRARINPKSLTHADVLQLQRTIGNRAVGKLLTEIGLIPSKVKQAPPVQMQPILEEEEKPLQGKFAEPLQHQEISEKEEESFQGKKAEIIQRQEIPEEEPLQTKRENNTGMPDNLKAGVENLSGIDMSEVRVHYNSSKPAHLGALAYTQGTNIHIALGQERHLPHEVWHVVQQTQGRVRPTMQLKGVFVNDDEGLEREADEMATKYNSNSEISLDFSVPKDSRDLSNPSSTIQMMRIIWTYNASSHIWVPNVHTSLQSPTISNPKDGQKVTVEYDDGGRAYSKEYVAPGSTATTAETIVPLAAAAAPVAASVTEDEYRHSEEEELAKALAESSAGSKKQQEASPTSAEFLSKVLGTAIDVHRGHVIPQQFHRFWSGGPMSKAAMITLLQSATKTQDTAWINNLWYSWTLEQIMDENKRVSDDDKQIRRVQRDQLRAVGYNVKPIEVFAVQSPRSEGHLTLADFWIMARKAAGKEEAGRVDKWDGIKFLADMARLIYLEEIGGHHLDVDMGIGDMDLSRPYYHNDPAGGVPLLGAVTAETRGHIVEHLANVRPSGGRDLRDTSKARSATEVAEMARDLSTFLNGMIASRPHNPHFKAAIEKLRVDDANPKSSDLSTGMTVTPTLLFGPNSNPTEEEKRLVKSQTVPPYLFDLQHLTDETDRR